MGINVHIHVNGVDPDINLDVDDVQIHRDKDRDRQILISQPQVSRVQATAPLWTRPDSILMATLQTQPGGKNHAGSSRNNTNTLNHLWSTRHCAGNLTCSISLNIPALPIYYVPRDLSSKK